MKIKRGDIVKIPFSKSMLYGLVWNFTQEKSPYQVKEITEKTAFALPQTTLDLIEHMRKTYETTYAALFELIASKAIFDKIIKDALNKKSDQQNILSGSQQADDIGSVFHTLPKSMQKNKDEEQMKNDTEINTLYIEKNLIDRAKLIALLKEKSEGQMLVVVPEQHTLHKLTDGLDKLQSDYKTYHGESTPKLRADAWENAYVGTPTLFITTRIGLFLPYKKLSHIVIIDDDSDAHEEIHKPHYHSVDIAEKLALLHHASLSFISPTPRLETWHFFSSSEKPKKIFYLTTTPPEHTEVEIIPMGEDRRNGGGGPLAEKTLTSIARTLAEQKQVLLFINRRGKAGLLLCKECFHTVLCTRCTNPLAVHNNDTLLCHHCGLTRALLTHCPNCDSVRLAPIMIGTQSLEAKLNTLFDRAIIVRLDRDALASRKKIREALNEDELSKADIIIATRMIDKPLNLPRLGLSVAVIPDTLLNIPAYNAHEKAVQVLNRLKINTHGKMIIQTYLPDCSVYQTVQSGNIEQFFSNEILIRKLLRVTPFE